MLRISPLYSGERLSHALFFKIEPGGSESNVAIALSRLGYSCSFITRLPEKSLTEKVLSYLRGFGVDHSHICILGNRIGTYWVERGVGVRPSEVIYDRGGSSFSEISYDDFEWSKIFSKSLWFHTSGITPAVSMSAWQTIKDALNRVQPDTRISIDLNYRSKLWRWVENKPRDIQRIMWAFCSKAYLLVGNETDFHNALGLGKGAGRTSTEYKEIAFECFQRLPALEYLAVSLRGSISASENNWSGLLFVKRKDDIDAFKGREFHITNIIDRVGTGDSFAAGLIHGILRKDRDFQHMLDFAIGLSALNHTVDGDASQFGEDDVDHFLRNPAGRIVR